MEGSKFKYSRDQGWSRQARQKAGLKKQKKHPQVTITKLYILHILLVGSKYGLIQKIRFLGAPKVGEKQCIEKREREESQSVLTMARYACKCLPRMMHANHLYQFRNDIVWCRLCLLYWLRFGTAYPGLCHTRLDCFFIEFEKNILFLKHFGKLG